MRKVLKLKTLLFFDIISKSIKLSKYQDKRKITLAKHIASKLVHPFKSYGATNKTHLAVKLITFLFSPEFKNRLAKRGYFV